MSPRKILKKAKGFACLLACLPGGGGGGSGGDGEGLTFNPISASKGLSHKVSGRVWVVIDDEAISVNLC